MVSIKKAKRYHKTKEGVRKIVIEQAKKNRSVLHGGHALNYYLPSWLDRHTEDFDIYTNRPASRAKELEKKLDKRYEADLFYVKKGKHKGTYRVMNRVTNSEVADYTRPEDKIEKVKGRDGVYYVSKGFIKRKIEKTLKDPESEYRHDKDRDALTRLRIAEEERKAKAKSRRPGIRVPVKTGGGLVNSKLAEKTKFGR